MIQTEFKNERSKSKYSTFNSYSAMDAYMRLTKAIGVD